MEKYLLKYIKHTDTGVTYAGGRIWTKEKRERVFEAENVTNAAEKAKKITSTGKLFKLEEIDF